MKYISVFVCMFVVLCSCGKKSRAEEYSNMYPPYRIINVFSDRIQPDTSLRLVSYGVNNSLPKNREFKNEVYNFSASYELKKESMTDEVSLEEARKLFIYVAEGLMEAINTDHEVVSRLDTFPVTSDLISLSFHFTDPRQIDLGQGVAAVHFSHGKIKYERYKIEVYTDRYPAIGRHYLMHEETYDEALQIVKGVEKKELQGA